MRNPLRPARSTAAALLALALAAPATAQKGSPPSRPPSAQVPPEEPAAPYPPLQGAEAEAVRDVLRRYQDAVRRRDGAAAAALVTREGRDYYGRMRDLAVSAPEAQVRALALMERINVLMFRHRLSAAELAALPAADAFAHTIRAGWVSANDGNQVAERAEVYGQGDRAALRYMGDMFFVRENGAWVWDMMPVLEGASEELGKALSSAKEEDEFVMLVLRLSNGREPSPDIWRPLP